MPIVWSDRHRLHEPDGEVFVGVRTPGTELPERADRIRDALTAAGASLVPAVDHPDTDALRLHDPAMTRYLRDAWADWQVERARRGPGAGPGRPVSRSPTPAWSGTHPFGPAQNMAASAGTFCFDTMTLIGPGTYDAARAALGCRADSGRSRS